jgi:hypothetical protein
MVECSAHNGNVVGSIPSVPIIGKSRKTQKNDNEQKYIVKM